MNWYKLSSARDDKREQIQLIVDKISEAISQAPIGGEETIVLLDEIIQRLTGEDGNRTLIPPSIRDNVLSLVQEARNVKKDSPQKCCELLEQALTYIY